MTPDRIKRNFKDRLEKAIELHGGLVSTAQRWTNRATTETMLAEQFCMYAAVQWEAFLSDLIIGYALDDHSVAIANLERRLTESIRTKFGEKALRCVSYDFDGPYTWDRLCGVLDPADWNITVKSSEALANRANELLAAKHAKLFSLDKADSQFINFEIAIRNYLGHRSVAARGQLRKVVASLSEPLNADFVASTANVGAYLKANVRTASRAVILARRLVTLSQKL